MWDAVHWSGWFAAGWAAAQEDYLPLSPTFRTLPAPFRTSFQRFLAKVSNISCNSFKDFKQKFPVFLAKSAQEDYLPPSALLFELKVILAPFRADFPAAEDLLLNVLKISCKSFKISCKSFKDFLQKFQWFLAKICSITVTQSPRVLQRVWSQKLLPCLCWRAHGSSPQKHQHVLPPIVSAAGAAQNDKKYKITEIQKSSSALVQC